MSAKKWTLEEEQILLDCYNRYDKYSEAIKAARLLLPDRSREAVETKFFRMIKGKTNHVLPPLPKEILIPEIPQTPETPEKETSQTELSQEEFSEKITEYVQVLGKKECFLKRWFRKLFR